MRVVWVPAPCDEDSESVRGAALPRDFQKKKVDREMYARLSMEMCRISTLESVFIKIVRE